MLDNCGGDTEDSQADDPMRPTVFGGAPAAVVEAVADAVVRKADADIVGAMHATGDICERLGRLECDVLRIHGVDISDQVEDLIRLYRNGGDAADPVPFAGLRQLAGIARSEYGWKADHEQAEHREEWATLAAAIDWIDGLPGGAA